MDQAVGVGSDKGRAAEKFKASISFAGLGFTFFHFDQNDHIFQQFIKTGEFYEQELLTALRGFLREGDLVVDVGANIGTHSVFFAGVCGCSVLAFEPNPAAVKLLRRNIAANFLGKRVKVHKMALGAQTASGHVVAARDQNLGTARVEISGLDNTAVKIARLDDVAGRRKVRLIKVDTEGMDASVIAGAEAILARDKPVISVEAGERVEFFRIHEILRRHGYRTIGSFNYTPTHIFAHESEVTPQSVWDVVLQHMALDYIDRAKQREQYRTRNEEFSQRLDDLPQRLLPRLDELHEDLQATRSSLGSEVGSHVQKLLSPVRSDLNQVLDRVADIETRTSAAADAIRAGTDELRAADADIRSQVTGAQSEARDGIGSVMERLERVESSIDGLEGSIAKTVRTSVDALSKEVETRLSGLDRKVSDTARASADALSEKIAPVLAQVQGLAAGTATLSDLIESGRAETGDLSKAVAAAREQDATASIALRSDLAALGARIAQALDGFDAKGVALVSRLNRKIKDEVRASASILSGKIAPVLAHVETVAADTAKLSNLVDANRAETAGLSRAVAIATEQAAAASSTLRSELAASETRMSQALDGIGAKGDALASGLDRLAHDVAASDERAQNRLGGLEAQVDDLGRKQAQVLGKAGEHETVLRGVRQDQAGLERSLRNAVETWEANQGEVLRLAETWIAADEMARAAADQSLVLLKAEILSLIEQQVRISRVKEAVSALPHPTLEATKTPPLLQGGAKAERPAEKPAVPVPAVPAVGLADTGVQAEAAARDAQLTPAELDLRFAQGVIPSDEPVRHEELVSIIMPSYNNEAWLTRAINSALSQRGVKIELLVVDDGSTDGSVAVARKIAAKAPNMRVISLLRNFGCYYARNIAVMNAKGDYITLLDSDDIMPLDRIARQLDAVKGTKKAVGCMSRLRRWTADFAQPISELKYGEGSLLWRRDIIETMGIYDSVRYGGDTEFRLRLQRNFGDDAIVRIPDDLYYARTVETSLTANGGSKAYAIENGAMKLQLSPERRVYSDNLAGWHRSAKRPRADFPLLSRPFELGGPNQNASPSLGQRRVGAVASFPPRRESLKATIESVLPQLDELLIYLNNYDDVPKFLAHPKIRVVRSQDAMGDLRDNGKFYDLPSTDDAYVFTFDDDLIYPPDYTARMIHYIEMLSRSCVVGLHGVIFPEGNFTELSQRTVYHFGFKQDGYFVDLLGTGTTAWHSSALKVSLEDFGSTGMCDLWFAAAAARKKVPFFSAPREKGWLKLYANFKESLYQEAVSQPQRYFDVYFQHVAPALKGGKNRLGMEKKLSAEFGAEVLAAAGVRLRK